MSIFNFTKSEFLFDSGDDMAMDTEGHIYVRVSEDCAMDLESGELNFTSGWDNDEQDDLWQLYNIAIVLYGEFAFNVLQNYI